MLSHRVRPPRTRYYDTEAIKDLLSVVDVIERSSAPFDHVELERRRMACFLHDGSNSTALSIFDDDRAWYCHSCRAGGDVIDLIAQLKQLSKADAIRVAALLAGVEAGSPPDPAIVKERAAARAQRAAAKAQAAALRRDENVRIATEIWWDVLNKAWWSGSRAAACATYLRSRELDAVLDISNRMHVVCAQADGSPAVPIYTFERGDPLTENAVVNIATRHVAPAPGAPKVTVLAGHTTRGTFGQSAQLLRTWDGGPRRLVLVEGLADTSQVSSRSPIGGRASATSAIPALALCSARTARTAYRRSSRLLATITRSVRGFVRRAVVLATDVDPMATRELVKRADENVIALRQFLLTIQNLGRLTASNLWWRKLYRVSRVLDGVVAPSVPVPMAGASAFGVFRRAGSPTAPRP
jgi:hypothetical protein